MKTIDIKRIYRKAMKRQIIHNLTEAGINQEILEDPDTDEAIIDRAYTIMTQTKEEFPSFRIWAHEMGHGDVIEYGRKCANKKRVKGRPSKKGWNSTPYRSKAERKNKGGKMKKKVVVTEEE